MSDLILDILQNRIGTGTYRRVTNGGPKGPEWAGPCPVCGGDDRFKVWPSQEGGDAARRAGTVGTWWCRQCDHHGDLIELLVFAKNLSFVEACKELRIELTGSSRQRPLRAPAPTPEWKPTVWPLPSEKWRSAATKLALEAQEHLSNYEAALKYLSRRGLPQEATEKYGLGFLTADDKNDRGRFRPRSVFGLPDETIDGKVKKTIWIPRGLTIPFWVPGPEGGQEVHRLRIRRLAEDLAEGASKFMMLKGSSQAPMTLPPTAIAPDRAVWVVVEAELCAMAVHFACGGRVGVMAALTNRGKSDAEAHKYLAAAPMILVALDMDPADEKGNRPGFQGWKWWEKTYAQAKRWPVPAGKDPGEAVALGVDLATWVSDALPKRSTGSVSGISGGREVGSPAQGGEAPAVEEQPVVVEGAGGSCGHDLGTFRYLLEDHQWKPEAMSPVCYRDNPGGTVVSFINQCRSCPSRPRGLDALLRKHKNA